MYGYGNSMFLATHGILARGSGGIDPDAQAFITAASITDPTQQSAINQLVVDLKGYNIWTKFKAIYPIVGGTAASHKWNLKDPRDLDAAFRLNYANDVTHSANGMVSNGTSGYADTFIQPATHLLNNSCHISFYSRTNQADGSWDCGVADDSNSYLAMNIRTAAGAFRPFAQDISVDTYTNPDSLGFYMANRTASNVKNGWKNGSKVVTSTATSGNRTNIKVFLLALNFGTPSFYSTRQCAFASIGDGLNDTEAANFYTAVQAYQVTLGRSIGTQTVSDADAQAFVNAANITDQVEANAINNLVIGMKADGLWTKMKAIYPIVGGSASSHAVNLKTPGTFNLTFATGWTHSSTGMTPNGTSAYADTFLNTSTQLDVNSHSFGMYSRTNNTTGSQAIGSFDNTPRFLQNNLSLGNFVSGLVGSIINYTANPSTSLLMLSRTSSTLSKAFRAGVLLGQETATMGTLPTFNFYLGARNNAGSAALYSLHQCAFAFIGEGLNDTEAANLYNRVQTYQTTLNRQV